MTSPSAGLRKQLGGLRRPGPRGVVVAAAVIYVVLLSFLSIYKHETYASSRFDLGNMDQAVWNSSEGRILEATNEEGELTSRLTTHADVLLLAFVPFYWIWASPHWLLVGQAAVVGLGAIPLFWLARRFLQREWPAALISVAYLFNPGLQSANLFDFHAQMMSGTLLLFAFYYLLERRLWLFVIFAVLASAAKEEISLIVAMMGLYAIFPLRRPRWGVPVFLAGVWYFLLVMLVVIPYFSSGGGSELVAQRYAAVGGSMTGVAETALTEPLSLLEYMFTGGKFTYLLNLLGTTGSLGIFAPLVLAIPLPELAINLLSGRPQMVDIGYQYAAPIIPFTYAAAAAGIANLVRLLRRVPDLLGRSLPGGLIGKAPVFLAAGVLLVGVQADYQTGPLPVFSAPGNYSTVVDPPSREHLRALNEAVELIPDGAKVSATNAVGPHLAHRRHLYLFPEVRDADYVIVDQEDPDYGLYPRPVLNLSAIQNLRESPEFERIYSRDGVLVFERVG